MKPWAGDEPNGCGGARGYWFGESRYYQGNRGSVCFTNVIALQAMVSGMIEGSVSCRCKRTCPSLWIRLQCLCMFDPACANGVEIPLPARKSSRSQYNPRMPKPETQRKVTEFVAMSFPWLAVAAISDTLAYQITSIVVVLILAGVVAWMHSAKTRLLVFLIPSICAMGALLGGVYTVSVAAILHYFFDTGCFSFRSRFAPAPNDDDLP